MTSTCPECGHGNLYESCDVSTGGMGSNLLPGLEGVFFYGKLRVVVCEGCGLMRLYAAPDALEKLSESGKWHKL